jgi:hypothetical protein
MVVLVDTLAAKKKLILAGFEEMEAEGIVEVVGSSQDSLASKHDLELLRADLTKDHESLRAVLTKDLELLRAALTKDVELLRADLTTKIIAAQFGGVVATLGLLKYFFH